MNHSTKYTIRANGIAIRHADTKNKALDLAFYEADQRLEAIEIIKNGELIRTIEPNTSLRLVGTLYRRLTEHQKIAVIQFIRKQLNGGAA